MPSIPDKPDFDEWFSRKIYCIPFLTGAWIEQNEASVDVLINCFGFTHPLFHQREYRLLMERLKNKPILGGMGGYFIFPIQREYNPLSGLLEAIKIGMAAYERNLSLHLHCRSGLHRSEMVKCAIFYKIKGVHLKEAVKLNMLLENTRDKHNMFPVLKEELEREILSVKQGVQFG